MRPAKDAKTKPAKPPRSLGWRMFFTTFKWCRISILLVVLVIIILGLFLNHVGLPDWLERRVEEQFRANGWALQFTKLRLRWYHGIVAEGLHLQRTNAPAGPTLFVQAAEFRLNWRSLQHLDLEPDSVMLRGGRLFWPLVATNRPKRTLVLEELGGELAFKRNDTWELKYIEANILNTHVRFRGDITNASLIREWRLPAPSPDATATPSDRWHTLLSEAEKVRFTGRPELNVIFSGDATDWKTFDTKLKFTATAVDSPWASGTNVTLAIELLPPPRTNEPTRIDIKASAQNTFTRWATATNLDLKLVFEPPHTRSHPTNFLLLIDLHGAATPWGNAGHVFTEVRSHPSGTNQTLKETRADVTIENFTGQDSTANRARITATLAHPFDNFFPATAQTAWTFNDLETPAATSQWIRVNTTLALPEQSQIRLAATNLAWFERIANLPFQANVSVSNTAISRLLLPSVDLQAHWEFPELRLKSGGQMETDSAAAQFSLNTESREVTFHVRGSMDHRRAASLISTNASEWIEDLSFVSPPTNFLQGRFVLRSVTNSTIAWRHDVLPTLSLAGGFDSPAGAFRGVPFSSIRIPITLTNSLWQTPGISLAQSNGAIRITGSGDQSTSRFHFDVTSDFDLLSLRPAMPTNAASFFDWFVWPAPPQINAALSGYWTNFATLGSSGNVAFTNTTFREQFVNSATTRFIYTNQLLSILDPFVRRKGEWGTADGIALDLAHQRLYLTNAIGKMAPRVITRAIGPRIDAVVAPYVFEGSPDAKTHGVFALKPGDNGHDVRFEVDGGPFHWERFHFEKAKAVLLWKGDTLTITNTSGRWHGATVNGSAFFDFDRTSPDNMFAFQARLEDGDLRKILKDLQPDRKGKVEGRVDGELNITRAYTTDWKSWQGQGFAHMTNGLLWDIPLFGVFSPILNAVLPGAGLGNSRARDAGMTFVISNSVIHTKDLEIRATAMRMNYKGTVDFDQTVEGRMEAELLRDFPAIGFLISKVLWPVTKLFEYEITGTLNDPKTAERYFISKALLAPLHPLKTLKELFNPEERDSPPSPPRTEENPANQPAPKSP